MQFLKIPTILGEHDLKIVDFKRGTLFYTLINNKIGNNFKEL